MTRYFTTIPEAVQLALQAAALGENGHVYLLDMGEPVKIKDLAAALIHLSGFRVGEEIAIEYTGVRPGEKLYEELMAQGEREARTPTKRSSSRATAISTPRGCNAPSRRSSR
jgi:FlaA1/EpsC-like NDP-sugar epimerase